MGKAAPRPRNSRGGAEEPARRSHLDSRARTHGETARGRSGGARSPSCPARGIDYGGDADSHARAGGADSFHGHPDHPGTVRDGTFGFWRKESSLNLALRGAALWGTEAAVARPPLFV